MKVSPNSHSTGYQSPPKAQLTELLELVSGEQVNSENGVITLTLNQEEKVCQALERHKCTPQLKLVELMRVYTD